MRGLTPRIGFSQALLIRGHFLRYQELLNLVRVRRIYLDEFDVTMPSIGRETIKLVVESEETVVTKAKVLIGLRKEMTDATQERDMMRR